MENRLRRGDAVQLWVLRNFPLCSRSLLFLSLGSSTPLLLYTPPDCFDTLQWGVTVLWPS